MKNLFSKIKKYWLVVILIIVVALIASYFVWFRSSTVKPEIITIAPTDFLQTVAVSGKVVPAKTVELGFNKSGPVAEVPVSVGQYVGAGQLIAALDSRDAAIAIENAKIDLQKMLETGKLNSSNNLSKEDESSLATIDKSYLDMSTIFDGLNSILNNYQVSTYKTNLPNDTARSYYQTAQTSYYKAKKSYDPALVNYHQLKRPLSKTDIAKLVEDTYVLAQSLSQAVNDSYNFVSFTYDQYGDDSRSPALGIDKSNLATWRMTVSNMIPLLGSGRNDINDSSLSIEAQKLVIAQKENDYANYFLRAPFAGVITRLDIKTGEQSVAGQATVSMINSGLFQIESYVPEIYIANLKVGNQAEVTLDAYGPETKFSAQVISIDPAETLRDGISTYKVKLQFSKDDARIKPGMTANLLITALKKPNTISVPAAAIITRGSQKFVEVATGTEGKNVEKLITTGELGALGQTEILSGLITGDQVILNPQTK